MQQYNIHLPLGTLALFLCKEYPTSLSAPEADMPALFIFPTEGADLDICAAGAMPPLPDIIAALTYYFASVRHLPAGALDVGTPYGALEIPLSVDEGKIMVPLAPCRRVFTESHELLGVSERISTVCDHTTTRIIENIERCPKELLSRLRVIDGMPVADRALSYKRTKQGYSVLSTDQRINADSLSPLARLLALRGTRGRVALVSRSGTMDFEIVDDGRVYAIYEGLTHTNKSLT